MTERVRYSSTCFPMLSLGSTQPSFAWNPQHLGTCTGAVSGFVGTRSRSWIRSTSVGPEHRHAFLAIA